VFTAAGTLIYTGRRRPYDAAPLPASEPRKKMRAEIENLADAAKQSIGLLRRHL
jgi:hypothetical protein